MSNAYAETDYLEDTKALEENPPKRKDFEQFAAKCADSGLSAMFHHETHWQVLAKDKPLVDFWPTANKVRPVVCKNKEKARKGNAADAIALATMLAAGSKPKAKADEPRLRRELNARAAMAGLLANPDNATCTMEKIAGWAVDAADALIAELDKSEVANG